MAAPPWHWDYYWGGMDVAPSFWQLELLPSRGEPKGHF